MGNLCKKPDLSIPRKSPPRDIEFKSFTGSNESYFDKIDVEINFLKYLELHQYLETLYSYGNKDDTDYSHKEEIGENVFGMFIELKLLKSAIVYSESISVESNYNLFKDYYSRFFTYLHKVYKNYYKEAFGEKLKQEEKAVPKISLIPLGIYQCHSTNKSKMELIFNTCSNDDYELESNSETLRMFIFFMLIIPSCVSLLSLNEVAKERDDIRKSFPEEIFIKMYDAYQVKDSLRELENVISSLFNGKEKLSYNEFRDNIIEKGLVWLFTSSGVRDYLEKHNE